MSRHDRAPRPARDRTNLYDDITGKIIADLEAGRFPWVQPWGTSTAQAPLGLPRNASTGRRYSGINILILWGQSSSSALVCTRVGGCAENVVDEETGLLVPPEDPQALAAACLRLLDDPVLARNMGVAAREYVKTHLSPAEIGRQMADFLRPLCRR